VSQQSHNDDPVVRVPLASAEWPVVGGSAARAAGSITSP
jgi:hypothetical protein